ncbi:Rpn family recombination-promoting nuclease/putative transposase [Limosilactobacillus reuteri]|uniref:Rpn family recombination-promoting nuclease/putative transposase n=2 Tax=Limosilactobacillus reuteri TaxID=1598 RepID=UPI001E4C84C3|nr:Rpn family recombination-promoting nuclease/putative transposase [Limosilactobacillus reuteri]MCC4411485.1 Rpn family recombination-promoting nuclease/putative transposase [Limosilactobacillus reuteri]MDL2056660.1 Rpn family recombination-promoting nuclease/putative transposase [Limosilactobacillus reuteri]
MNEFLQKKWEAADLTDDYIFNKVMLDYDICLEVLRRILPDLHIKKIDLPNNQQEIALAPDAKAVRFDIYTTDEQGNHYDIEMQVADHHNIAKRIRYYQTASSMEAYDKGQPYEKADDSYVIFFCNFDPFQLEEQRYILHKHIDGVPEYVVKDGQTDILFNVPSLKHDVNPKMQAFLDMIAQRKVEENDPLVVKLRKRMAVVKRNRKWRSEYMRRSVYEMDQEMREQRIKEDEEQIKKDQEQIKKEKQELKEANQRLVEDNQRLVNTRNVVIKSLICTLRNLDLDNHLIKKEIKKNFDLKDEEIDKYLK